MPKNNPVVRAIVVVLVTCFLNTVMPFSNLHAQAPECTYDRANPSLESARISFKSLNYVCAEQEIQEVLKLESLTTEQRADAHVLLAAVYYAKVKDEKEKRSQVISQFKQAFRSYRDWRGELDISSTEFIDMMREAQTLVDQEQKEAAPAEEPKEEQKVVAPVPVTPTKEVKIEKAEEPAKEGKPFYKQWWALALGVGLVAGAIVLAGGGGDDDGEEPDGPLPGFPDTPKK